MTTTNKNTAAAETSMTAAAAAHSTNNGYIRENYVRAFHGDNNFRFADNKPAEEEPDFGTWQIKAEAGSLHVFRDDEPATYDSYRAWLLTKDKSERIIYVDRDFIMYDMTKEEFLKHIEILARITKTSKANGEKPCIKLRTESPKFMVWLTDSVTTK